MNESAGTRDHRSLLKKALIEIQGLRAQLEQARRPQREPLAVIGIGCRFPGGADSPESFWRLLRDGVDAVGAVPPDRWNADADYGPVVVPPETIYTRTGAFLDHIDEFDPAFFSIPAAEAASMDPQQRLLLEVTWEAFEHACLPPDRVEESRTAVFLGITNMCDFYRGLQQPPLRSGTGISNCIAVNRLSHVFNLKGPSLALDTACSSSMVALHLACRSLREGESDMALVAGVNAILSPDWMVTFSMAGMMSPDGLCKSFDASADGYVRAEGCAVILLRRLEDARRDGNRVLALVRGTASNQDGRSSGLTVPHGAAQQEVVRSALADAGVEPNEIGFVEAHGIGTEIGDPIEVAALKEVLSQGRSADQGCLIGSVKANMGHAEAASGLCGLIKTVLALRHAEIPPQLHLRNLNPLIELDGTPFRIPTRLVPWPAGYARRLACVNSFGLGGTNAHAVLEAPTAEDGTARTETGSGEESCYIILPVSAKTEAALRELAGRYAQALAADEEVSLPDFCYAASAGRTHFPHRIALVTRPKESGPLKRQLQAYATSEAKIDCPALLEPPRVAFIFGGDANIDAESTGEYHLNHPVFRDAAEECSRHLQAIDRQTEAERVEAMLFTRQYGLLRLLDALGIVPAAVLGHSTGEYVAALAAGVFGLETALELAVRRGTGGSQAPKPSCAAPRRTWISGITGESMPANRPPDAAYWHRQIAEPVHAGMGLDALAAAKIDFYLVFGGRRKQDGQTGASGWLYPAEEVSGDADKALFETLAALYVGGSTINWNVLPSSARNWVDLPTYPFQWTHCRLDSSELKSYL